MCTLTYFPISRSKIVITSNRDESRTRPTNSEPSVIKRGDKTLHLVQDLTAGGTWFAVSESGSFNCLLNGAFQKHEYNPPYAKSRGIVLLEAFDYPDLKTFSKEYNFDGIEPFTLVGFHKDSSLFLEEVRWDGKAVHHLNKYPYAPEIWSSSSLYSDKAKLVSRDAFTQLMVENKISRTTLREFNLSENYEEKILRVGEKPYPEVTTLGLISLTINFKRGKVRFSYWDFKADKEHTLKFKIHA